MKKRRYIMLFGDTGTAVNELSDDAAGRLLKAILRYADNQDTVELPGEEKFVYRMLLAQFARDDEAYQRKSEYNRRFRESQKEPADDAEVQKSTQKYEEVQKSTDKYTEVQKSIQYKEEDKEKDKDHDKEKEKDKDEDNDKESVSSRAGALKPTFTPPTPDEVAAYCKEANLAIDPVRFCDYNASRGWVTGGQPMVDWKPVARMWASKEWKPSASGAPPGAAVQYTRKLMHEHDYEQREYVNSFDALDRMMVDYEREKQEESVGDSPPTP